MITRRESLTYLSSNNRGVAAVEFAMLAPVLALFLVGSFDIAHTLYMKSVLYGIVQKTGRDSALQGAGTAAAQSTIDQKVKNQVLELYNTASIKFTRRNFITYVQAAAKVPETWTDTNLNKSCDSGEPYVDLNDSGYWDQDGGSNGQGGAKDRVIYTVEVTYPSILPLYRFTGGSSNKVLTATTVLQNQPFSDQLIKIGTAVRFCL